MDALEALRVPVSESHQWLEATMSDVTPEQAHWRPPGIANPICAVYAHVIVGADFAVNTTMRGQPPLIASKWAGKVGLSELMPMADWHEWAGRLRMDLDVFRQYARDAYACWDDCLASFSPGDLDRVVDLSAIGMGQRTLARFLAMQVEHFSGHCGEIACLKGLQGATGYRPGTADGIG